jgi:hypothetical protein
VPAYSQGATLYSISPGDQVTLWSAETPAIGSGSTSASTQVALVRCHGEGGTPFSVSGYFSAAPGTFEVDVQVSDQDVDGQYQTVANGNITTVDSTNQTFHFDGSTINAKFVRLLMRARANAVSITADIRR